MLKRKNVHIEDIVLALSLFIAIIISSGFFPGILATALIFYIFSKVTKNMKSKKKIYYISSVILIIVAIAQMISSNPSVEVSEAIISEKQEVASESAQEIFEISEDKFTVPVVKTEVVEPELEVKTLSERDEILIILKDNASDEWGTDYVMVKWEYEQQVDAYDWVVRNATNSGILQRAKNEWGTDYVMVKWEYEQQLEAYGNL